ncbi:MAG: hypothetical protein SCJ93_14565, partial [Bacillota bacterium]|nr:hypothetical protein [Bacillota bacterium]
GKDIDNLIDYKDQLKVEENKVSQIDKDIKIKSNIESTEKEIKRLEKEIGTVIKDKNQLKKEYEEKSVEYDNLKDKYFSNMGAVLAKELKAGEACPVCGSKDHVKKAEFKGKGISKKDLDKLDEEVSKMIKKINKFESEEAVLSQKIKSLMDNVEEYIKDLNNNETHVEDLKKQHKDINQKISDIDQKIKASEESRKRRKELEEIIDKLENQKKEKSAQLKLLEIDITKYETQMEELNKSLKGDEKYEELLYLIENQKEKLKEKQEKKEETNKKFDDLKGERIRLETQLKGIEESLKKTKKELTEKENILLNKINEKGFEK